MSLYEELVKRKNTGEMIRVEDLSAEELTQLYIDEEITDRILAELFNVKQSKITYRRRKLGITLRNAFINELLLGKSEETKEMNRNTKQHILNTEKIDMISKAITHFVFRNGPIENMHAYPNNQLSEEDMMILNKFMVNRLAYIFTLIIEERWLEFYFLIKLYSIYGQNWDEAEPDDGGIRKLIEMIIKDAKAHNTVI